MGPGIIILMLWPVFSPAETPQVELRQDETAGRLRILIDGREALVYQYAATLDLPHYWPLRSPGGKNMLVQKTEPYPHHRSFWLADTVRLAGGREVSFYNAFYSGRKTGENVHEPPFRDHIRQLRFTRLEAKGAMAAVDTELVWEMDEDTPVLKEDRRLTVYALGDGEYFLDLTFKLISAYGNVEFVSDDVHYAWPYLRLVTEWSGEAGGTIISDTGARGQEATNMKFAKWIDYSNTVSGETAGVAVLESPLRPNRISGYQALKKQGALPILMDEGVVSPTDIEEFIKLGMLVGVAIFVSPDHPGFPVHWLIRNTYGGFFNASWPGLTAVVLKPGEPVILRYRIYVHRGDAEAGEVSAAHRRYLEERSSKSHPLSSILPHQGGGKF